MSDTPTAAKPRNSERETSSWQGLEVVVTGGTGGLGTAVVTRLLEAGASCHVPVWDPEEAASFPHRDHPRVRLQGADLGTDASVEEYFADLPPLWASIHCAGGFAMSSLAETSGEAYERLMQLNATTCFLCCREAVKKIRQRTGPIPGGRLVNVAARPALEPRQGAGMVVYTMSKAAVAALTQSLGEELSSERIWVNAVAPSIIDTAANRQAMPDAPHQDWRSPEAIAETIVFLASPQNRSTRGALVPVYGAA